MSVFQVITENGKKKMIAVTSEEQYRALRGTSEQYELVEKARSRVKARRQVIRKDGSKTLVPVPAKTMLVQFNYSCLPTSEGFLAGSQTPSGSVGMDVDLESRPDELSAQYKARLEEIPARVLAKKDELGLLMLERSATKGYHLVFRRKPGLTQEENLSWASQLLGVKFDKNAKDITRVFFTTTDSAEDLLFLSPELFDNSELKIDNSRANREERKPAFYPEVQPRINEVNGNPYNPYNPCFFNSHLNCKAPKEYLVKSLEEQMGGAPAHGGRNTFIYSMACHLTHVYGRNPAALQTMIPTYGHALSRWASTIQSACEAKKVSEPTDTIRRAISVAEARWQADNEGGGKTEVNPEPACPAKLPPLMALLTSKVPDFYKPAVAMNVFPALGTHLKGVQFIYIDNQAHESTFMSTLMAKMSIGKSCINKPIDYILADIKERDAENRRREQEWKTEMNRKGANKEKPKRPDDLCIQCLVSDMTNAAFVQRLQDAGGRFLYTRMDEIELLDQLKTSSRGQQVSQIIRLAFDNQEYGQERVGSQSVTASVKIRWNWNASTTIQKGRDFFRDKIANGTMSRISFSTIKPQAPGSDIPVIGTYDESFAEALKPYIDHLNDANGIIVCPEAQDLAKRMLRENADRVSMTEDENYEMISYRALLLAYLRGCVLYTAHGCEWSKEIEQFVRWSYEYDMWCKMMFFGDLMETAFSPEKFKRHKGPGNMLQMLPEEFNLQQVIDVRRSAGKASDPRQMITNWLHRKLICLTDTDGVFKKTLNH